MKTILSLNLAIFIAIIFSINTGCKKCDVPKGTPSCIKNKIRKMQSGEVTNPPGSVLQYNYRGTTVYYFPATSCCDQLSQLYDDDCNLICSPDGGLTGRGDGTCTDFIASRTNEKLIWRDNRK